MTETEQKINQNEYMFPPDGIIWRVHKHNCSKAAGLGAVLSQVMRVEVGYGVYNHSYFYDHVLDRLHNTTQLTSALYVGTRDEAIEAARQINRMHKPVQGTVSMPQEPTVDGMAYSARNSDLVKSVWETIVYGGLRSYNIFVEPLSTDEMDEFVDQSRKPMQYIGGKIDEFPSTYRDMMLDMEQQVADGKIRAFPYTYDLKSKIYHPFSKLKTMTGLMEEDMDVIAGGFMHPAYREQLIPWSPTRQHRFEVLVGGMRAMYHQLPDRVKYKPQYLEYVRGNFCI